MTTRANLYVDQGTTFLASLDLFTFEGEEFDVDSQEFFCDVRKMYSSAKAFSAEVTTVNNGETNTLDLFISSEATENVKPGKNQYDIVMVSPNGERQKILEGLLFVMDTITRND